MVLNEIKVNIEHSYLTVEVYKWWIRYILEVVEDKFKKTEKKKFKII